MDFSNYEKQGPRAGHTVPYEVTELRNADGTHPIVHIEHLGRSNASLLEEMLAEAGAENKPSGFADKVDKGREQVIRHSARRLENAFFSDGTPAGDAHLSGFIRAMPMRALERLVVFAMTEDRFCEYPIMSNPQALAEK